jgi:hypothetical protein
MGLRPGEPWRRELCGPFRGLQNALATSGGSRWNCAVIGSRTPASTTKAAIPPPHQALRTHYGHIHSRNNRGVAHENGIVEATHGHKKGRMEQKVLLRARSDFDDRAEFAELLAEVFSALNGPCQRRYKKEVEDLSILPAFSFADYELLPVRVRSTRTKEVRKVATP